MSERIAIIENTGVQNDRDLQITEFWGGTKNGKMIQLTQGFGGQDEPGYIQLHKKDMLKLFKCVGISILSEYVSLEKMRL